MSGIKNEDDQNHVYKSLKTSQKSVKGGNL